MTRPIKPARRVAVVATVVLLALLASLAGLQRAAAADSQTTAVGPIVLANQAAAAGDHAAAARPFQHALAARGWSSGALLGLGNAYAAAGEHGRAILAFERARLLAPRDADVAANLAHTRSVAGVSSPPESRVYRAAATLTADEWTWIALGASVLACLGIVGFAWRFHRGPARALAIAGAMASAIAVTAGAYVAPPQDRAIVVTREVARISPFAGAEVAFEVLDGEAVHIEQRRGDFVYVRHGDRAGWLPRAAVERVVGELDAPHADAS